MTSMLRMVYPFSNSWGKKKSQKKSNISWHVNITWIKVSVFTAPILLAHRHAIVYIQSVLLSDLWSKPLQNTFARPRLGALLYCLDSSPSCTPTCSVTTAMRLLGCNVHEILRMVSCRCSTNISSLFVVISQLRRLRHREEKGLVHRHLVSQWHQITIRNVIWCI